MQTRWTKAEGGSGMTRRTVFGSGGFDMVLLIVQKGQKACDGKKTRLGARVQAASSHDHGPMIWNPEVRSETDGGCQARLDWCVERADRAALASGLDCGPA